MNRLQTTALVLITATFAVQAAPSPGLVDFGQFSPPAKGEFVEVNIGKPLISIVARILQRSEAEAAEVLRGLERVRVNVIALDKDNRKDVQERITAIRAQLDGEGWDPIVTVKDKAEDVAIYLKTRGEEAVEGLVVTVLSGNKQAVLVNIVGHIQPEKVAMVAEKLKIEPLKKAASALKN